jgi:hypothetical protein
LQQNESLWQTQAWMVASLHPFPSWTWQQSPVLPHWPQSSGQVWQLSPGAQVPSPQSGAAPQVPQPMDSTSVTHIESHWLVQQ